MIRALLTALALICAADRASALTDMPFNPHPVEVDYVVTMNFFYGSPNAVRTITHHGGWLRIDTSPGRPATIYYGRNEKVRLNLHKNSEELEISIFSGNYDPLKDFQPTGERQTHLGESCAVWRYTFSWGTQRLKCITDDGIELWDRFVSKDNKENSTSEAIKIERRPVDKAEVNPPYQLLDIGYWLNMQKPKSGPVFQSSTEVVLEHKDVPGWSKIVRQIGPWYFRMERQNGIISRLRIVDLSAGFNLQYSQIVSGGKLLQISSRLPYDHKKTFPLLSGVETGEKELVLGEECKWISKGGGLDHHHFQCLTSDGALLKEKSWGYGSRSDANTPPSEATRLTRGAVKLEDVMPPKELLLRRTWGLPG